MWISSALNIPVEIIASTMFLIIFYYCKTHAATKLRLVNISRLDYWTPIFNCSMCGSIPGKSNWLKFCWKLTVSEGLVRDSLALNNKLNNIVKFINIFVLGPENNSFTQPVAILIKNLNNRNCFFNQFFFWRHYCRNYEAMKFILRSNQSNPFCSQFSTIDVRLSQLIHQFSAGRVHLYFILTSLVTYHHKVE